MKSATKIAKVYFWVLKSVKTWHVTGARPESGSSLLTWVRKSDGEMIDLSR